MFEFLLVAVTRVPISAPFPLPQGLDPFPHESERHQATDFIGADTAGIDKPRRAI